MIYADYIAGFIEEESIFKQSESQLKQLPGHKGKV